MAEFKADKENPEAAKAAENLSGKIRKTRRYRFEIAPNTETAIRQSYSWIPTEILVQANGHAKLLGPIHQLPLTEENRPLYRHIMAIFVEMIPLFQRLHVLKPGVEQTLQVVIKAQSYLLLPGMTYSGKWHTEGETENIVAAGVYYAEIGSELRGGKLKFRPPFIPEPNYAYKDVDVSIPVKQGAAIAFSNAIPHRFRKITNPVINATNSHDQETDGDKEYEGNGNGDPMGAQRRTFLNFFIVDPSHPLKQTTRNTFMVSFDELALILRSAVRQKLNTYFPLELIRLIAADMRGFVWSQESAKAFRALSRAGMLQRTSGWGWMNWGNCGTVEFISSWDSAVGNRGELKENDLRHTQSDNPSYSDQ